MSLLPMQRKQPSKLLLAEAHKIAFPKASRSQPPILYDQTFTAARGSNPNLPSIATSSLQLHPQKTRMKSFARPSSPRRPLHLNSGPLQSTPSPHRIKSHHHRRTTLCAQPLSSSQHHHSPPSMRSNPPQGSAPHVPHQNGRPTANHRAETASTASSLAGSSWKRLPSATSPTKKPTSTSTRTRNSTPHPPRNGSTATPADPPHPTTAPPTAHTLHPPDAATTSTTAPALAAPDEPTTPSRKKMRT